MLSDLAVLELGATVPAASAGTMLRKFGADVSWLREGAPAAAAPTQRDRLLGVLRGGKREVEVGDMWGEEATALAAEADVVIADIGASPFWREADWLERYEATVRRSGRAAWVTISPFGLNGPLRRCRGGELVATASGGIARYMRQSDGRPMKPAGFTTSIGAGHFAALAALHATLLSRERGEPVHLDLSMQDAVLVTGVFLEISHVLFDCSSEGGSASYAAPVGFIQCSDGLVWLLVLEQHQWQGCVRAIGSPDWATAIETREERYAQSEDIKRRVEEWASTLTAADVAARLQAEGVPATKVNTCSDLVAGEGIDVARGFFVHPDAGAPEKVPGLPLQITPRRSPVSNGDGGARRPRVLEVSQVLVTPLAMSWLGAMGIDVLKLEDPERVDVYRRVGPFLERKPDPEASAYFAFANYSKRSHAIELESPEGQDGLAQLIAEADVVVTNLSPGRARRVGLTPEALDAKGGASLVSSSGFGSSTEHATYRAYGLNIQAAGGVVHLSRDRAGMPRNLGTTWADPLSSVWIAMSTMAQLLGPAEQRRHVEVSMVEAIACVLPEYFAEATAGGAETTADGNRLDHAAPHDVYRCAGDDAWLALAVETDDEWQRLVGALGDPQALQDGRFKRHADRLANRDELDLRLEERLAGRDRDETFAALQALGIACAPVWGATELLALPHLQERELLQMLDHLAWGPRPLMGLPWRIAGEGAIPVTATPLFGEHTGDGWL